MESINNQPPLRPEAKPCFELQAITKRFEGVAALSGVSLALRPGEIHALIGENGAGKSTLINVSTGVLQPDEGRILVAGAPVRMQSPRVAAAHGVVVVHQEADLFAELSLAENMLLGEGLVRRRGGLVNWPATWRKAQQALEAMDEHADVRAPAHKLSIGRRVIAEIAASVSRRPRVLFLDEPTASLTHGETRRLIEQLYRLRAAGVAIVYVSHRLEEVLEISDTITVMRDGRHVATQPKSELTMEQLIALMVGRAAQSSFTRAHSAPGEPVFAVQSLSSPNGEFRDVSFEIRRGEILGLYGLVGAGRTEMARALFGLAPSTGHAALHGQRLRLTRPSRALAQKLAYLPEDRLTEGIFATHSCRGNLTAAVTPRMGRFGFISRAREQSAAARVIGQFRVKLDTPEQAINTLSGGNQQKLMLGRWLETEPEVLILDEPTRGVDVGAKAELHRLIDELAQRGKAILLISSELPEVMQMSDRVLVMAEGRISGTFDPRRATQDDLVAAAIPRAKPKTATEQRAAQGFSLWRAVTQVREIGIIAALVAITLLMILLRPSEFATIKNLLDVLTSASIVSVAAAGMALVIITGGIDISIGSMLGLVGAAAGMAAIHGAPPLACLALAVVFGGVLGLLNSALSTLGRIHPIIVTLAGISVYRGAMLQLTGGYEVNPLPDAYRALADGRVLLAPKVMWIALAVMAANWVLLSHTLTGRRLLAVGNSEKAARLIGLSPWKLRLFAFIVLGGLVGLASVMWGGYYGKVQSNTGEGFEMLAIAATVIGGCSILGGRGTALGTFLGAVLIALIYNCLVILKISAYWQNMFVGALILAAVLVDIWLPVLTEKINRRSAHQ
jgi:ABC-type sugar transport system ATPase subunit/ribose/xylose/arabinose/galactoside ABC-type transport system permease subunit